MTRPWKCECSGPGNCPRLDGCFVDELHYTYCTGNGTSLNLRKRDFYLRKMVEYCHWNRAGRPVSENVGKAVEVFMLGDAVENALSSVGITKDRVKDWLGGCGGCSERQEKLNQLSAWATQFLAGTIADGKDYLRRIMGQ